MTSSLQNAFNLASALPEPEQEHLAAVLIEEMADDKKWQESFEKSKDELLRMAAEAVAEDDRGETRDLDELL